MKSSSLIKILLAVGLSISAGAGSIASAHDYDRNSRWKHSWQSPPVYQRDAVRQYNYIYYPRQQVYFSPSNNNWFWASGNGWQAGTRLPAYLTADLRSGGVPVSLRSERPYVEHAYVETSYGRPWRESHAWRGWPADRRDYPSRFERGYERRDDDRWRHHYRHHAEYQGPRRD